MLKSIDRIQIAAHSIEEASVGWRALLGAELQSEDRIAALDAKRASYRLGRSVIEILEPDGAGAIADALQARGRAHLFAAGLSTEDFEGTLARLRSKGIEPSIENGQAFFNAEAALGIDTPVE